MSSEKVALISDTHFGSRADSIPLMDYFEDFYSQVFFPRLEKEGIHRIIHYGDLLDRRKFVNYLSAKRMKDMFFRPAMDRNIRIDLVPGNHDVYYKTTNEVNSLEELLPGFPNVQIHSRPTVLDLYGTPALLVPWINNVNHDDFMKDIRSTDCKLIIGHFEFSGFEMYRGIKNEDGMSTEDFRRFHMVITGHYHHKSDDGTIYYTGAPYQMTWADHGDQRGFHLLTPGTFELEFVENPLEMFHTIYYNDEHMVAADYADMDVEYLRNRYVKVIVVKKTKPGLYEHFLERIHKADPINLAVLEDMSMFHESNVDDEGIVGLSSADILEAYIDAVPENEMSVDRERLKRIVKALYVEASYAE